MWVLRFGRSHSERCHGSVLDRVSHSLGRDFFFFNGTRRIRAYPCLCLTPVPLGPDHGCIDCYYCYVSSRAGFSWRPFQRGGPPPRTSTGSSWSSLGGLGAHWRVHSETACAENLRWAVLGLGSVFSAPALFLYQAALFASVDGMATPLPSSLWPQISSFTDPAEALRSWPSSGWAWRRQSQSSPGLLALVW